jgi:hypothetical protein
MPSRGPMGAVNGNCDTTHDSLSCLFRIASFDPAVLQNDGYDKTEEGRQEMVLAKKRRAVELAIASSPALQAADVDKERKRKNKKK